MGYPKVDDEYDGRYRIVRRIGHGGMGVVYEAVDKVLNRSVALKIVLPSLPDREDFHARFAREASVLARIRSRNIVGIHEYGEHDDTVYFVTELFPDGDLRSWLAEHGPLDRRAALSLVAQVCEALADAHAAGVIHRDVKPGNVLLWNRPEGLIPYLADFGIALDGNAIDQEGLTRAGTLVGSPAYMAPERHFGHAADERGDVYSVGCLLWAVLTGDAPYAGTDFQMINSHVNSPTPQLATGHPVDERIDEVLAHALHKDPAQRVQSAQELREALLSVVRDIDSGRLPVPGPAAPGVLPTADPPATDEAREPDDDRTAVKPVAAVAATPADEPRTDEPRGDSTVVRDVVVPAVRGASPVAGPAGPAPGGRRRRRSALAAAGAAGLVAAVALTAFAVASVQDGDGDPVATDPSQTAAPPVSSAPTPTASPLPAPAAPRATARPAYRAVTFVVRPPRSGGDLSRTVEYHAGEGWQELRGRRVTLPTEQGGERACVRTRTTVEDPAGQVATSEVARTCGRAAARVVRLVRSAAPCSTQSQGFTYPCAWYGVEVAGFASGTRPRPQLRSAMVGEWCQRGVDCVPIPVGRDGRGRVAQLVKVARDEGLVTLVVDGVTIRTRVAL